MATVILIVLAYIAGSTPFGLLVAWAVGRIDIRTVGSGNIGATNVGRVLGSRWGLLVLILDLLKGLLPVLFLPQALLSPENAEPWRVAVGIATILGHIFPFWLGFRGGKGVATALGVVLCLAPAATAAAAAAFVASFLVWKTVSLSSILAAVTFATTQIFLLWPNPFSATAWPLAVFSLLVPTLIVLRHRSNIARLLRGEEPPFRRLSPPAVESPRVPPE